MVLKIGIVGASGRMGAELLSVAKEFSEIQICAAIVSSSSSAIGKPTAVAGVNFSEWDANALAGIDGVIDFSIPAVSVSVASACAERGIPVLVGTTGFSATEREQIKKTAEKTAVMLAPNTSIGVSVLAEVSSLAQKLLGDDFDIELSEIHHRDKKDAPSGTARALADRLIAEGDLKEKFQRPGKRNPRELGISSIRGGGVFGEHTIYFLGNGERIELTHRAESRSIFARGAYRLFLRLNDKKPGFYSVRDLL